MTDNNKILLIIAVLLVAGLPGMVSAGSQKEKLDGYYSRDGNNGSPSETSRNNIYIKFFEDRWLGIMFVPYPYASDIEPPLIAQVFDRAKNKTSSASYMKGKFDLLAEPATLQIERYGYLEDRIVFECGSLSPCTIKLDNGSLELIKPGVINEHIIKYNHVNLP